MTTKQKQKQTNKQKLCTRKEERKERKITENLHTSPGKDSATRPRVQVQDY